MFNSAFHDLLFNCSQNSLASNLFYHYRDIYHIARKVTAWPEERKAQIELFYLPPYSPEYNPDELLNSDIKRNAGAKQSLRNQSQLESNVQNRLDYLSSTPALIASFFLAPFTKYAA